MAGWTLGNLFLAIVEWSQARQRREMAGTSPAPLAMPVLTAAETAKLSPAKPDPLEIPKPPPSDLWPGDVPYAALDLSEGFEGRKLAPYKDSNGTWTIGIGSTRDSKGNPVTAKTPAITNALADVMAMRDLERAAGLVRKAVTTPLTNRQAAVLILMANNLGDLRVAGPTLVRLVNEQRWREAANFMRNFEKERIKGVLTPSKGLRRRRWAEAAYFLGMDAKTARARAWAEITSASDWPVLPG